MELEIIYEDDDLVAINKPHGLLVHRSSIAADVEEFALQILRKQLGDEYYLYPIHRLDRKTSGVLLFGKHSEIVPIMKKQFDNRSIKKVYKAIVRGWLSGEALIDYPVKNDRGNAKEAISTYVSEALFEIPLAHGKFETSRYSLINLEPKTGRWHQLRQHMNHLRHPILGDRPHGCSKQNRLWKSTYGMTKMMLWAKEMTFTHPRKNSTIHIEAKASDEWNRVLDILTKK